MRRPKCLVTVGAALMIVALLTLGSSAAASSFKVIEAMTWEKSPYGGLVFDAAGNLYGTTWQGGGSGCGGYGCGVVYKLKPNSTGAWTVSILHNFTGADGAQPYSRLVRDAAGNLYGTAAFGGGSGGSGCGVVGCGVVFKLSPNSNGTWAYSVLHRFTGADGNAPKGGLVFDALGNLYGTTVGGGGAACGCGVVFKLSPNPDGTWTDSVLHSFTGAGGSMPTSGLIFDAAGNLYGTTGQGGGPACYGIGCGVVFKLSPNSNGTWAYSALHRFTGADGAGPNGLVFDAAGVDLYGTTGRGNVETNWGVVFKLSPNPDGTWTESVLHVFSVSDGSEPPAGVIFDAAGNLYGTTLEGGKSAVGVVFKLAPNPDGSWTESVLHNFCVSAFEPISPLVFDQAGNLYGTTLGGSNNQGTVYGTVFELTP